MPEKDLLAVPDAVSDEAAAQFLVNPATGEGLLRGVREGRRPRLGVPDRLHWGRMPGP